MTQQGQGVAQPPYPREPNVHSGGKQEPGGDRDLPPYEDRQKEGPGTDKEQLLQERGGVPGHEAGPRDISQEESAGYSDTDTAPKDIHGVGASTSTSGASARGPARGKGAKRSPSRRPSSTSAVTSARGSGRTTTRRSRTCSWTTTSSG